MYGVPKSLYFRWFGWCIKMWVNTSRKISHTSNAVILATVSSPNSSLEAKTVVGLFVCLLAVAAKVATRSRIDRAITIEMMHQWPKLWGCCLAKYQVIYIYNYLYKVNWKDPGTWTNQDFSWFLSCHCQLFPLLSWMSRKKLGYNILSIDILVV